MEPTFGTLFLLFGILQFSLLCCTLSAPSLHTVKVGVASFVPSPSQQAATALRQPQINPGGIGFLPLRISGQQTSSPDLREPFDTSETFPLTATLCTSHRIGSAPVRSTDEALAELLNEAGSNGS